MADINGGTLHYEATLGTSGMDKGVQDVANKLRLLNEQMKRASENAEELKNQMKAAKEANDAKAFDEIAKALNSTQDEIRNLNTRISYYNEQLKEVESSSKNVEKQTTSMRSRMAQLREEIYALEDAGKDNTAEYRNAAIELAKLQDQMGDNQAMIRHLASDTMVLDEVMGAANFGASAFSVLQGTMEAVGVESENVEEAQKKLQAAIAITTGLTQIQNAMQKQSALMLGVNRVQEIALAKAKELSTKQTIAATIAQKAFNLVAKANPYVLLATGIAAIAAAMFAFGKKTKEATEELDDFHKALQDSEASARKEISAIDALISIASDVKRTYNERKNAIDQLNQTYPLLNAQLKGEHDQLVYNIQAYEQYTQAIKNNARAKALETKLEQAEVDKMLSEERIQKLTKQFWNTKDSGERETLNMQLQVARAQYAAQINYSNQLASEIAGLKLQPGSDLESLKQQAQELKAKIAESVSALEVRTLSEQLDIVNAQIEKAQNKGGNSSAGSGEKYIEYSDYYKKYIANKTNEQLASAREKMLSSAENIGGDPISNLFGSIVKLNVGGDIQSGLDQIARAEMMVVRTAEQTTERLEAEYRLQQVILQNMTIEDGESVDEFNLRVAKQQKAVNDAKNAVERSKADSEIAKVSRYVPIVKQVSASLADIADSINDINFSKLVNMLGDVSDSFETIVNGIKEDETGKLSLSISSVLQVWLKLLEKVVSMALEDWAFNEKMYLAGKEVAYNMKLVANQLKDIYDNGFGTDSLKQFTDAVGYNARLRAEQSRMQASMDKDYTRRYWGAGKLTYSYLGGYQYGRYNTPLRQEVPWLFNADGSLNMDMLDTFINSEYFEELGEDLKKDLKYLNDIHKQIEENAKAMKEYISSIFGEMGDAALNSIVNAIRTGADSWEDFRKAGEAAIESLGESLIYNLFLADQFSAFGENIKKYVDTDGSVDWEGIMNETSSFMNEMQSVWLPAATEFGRKFKEAAESNGLKIWSGDEAESMSGSIQNVTEQTASVIAGQMNAIRQQQIDTNSIVREQLLVLSGIKSDTAFLRSIDSKLEDIRYIARLQNA